MKYLLIIFVLSVSAVSTNAQNSNPALRDELLKMREVDQQARTECVEKDAEGQIQCLAEISKTIDTPNLRRIEEIYDQYGFPTTKMVGRDGVEAFLLILQHAPDDRLREKCLKPITRAFKRKEISAMDYANFVDRLLVHQGKPQIYGSNFDFKDNKLVMSKVKDPKNLDRRRAKIGLPPIAEYAQKLKEIYNLDVEIPAL